MVVPELTLASQNEISVYEGYPDSEFWSPVDHPDELGAERLDDFDHINVNFDGQNHLNVVIPADDEMCVAFGLYC